MFYNALDGYLRGLIFFSGDKEIARIGDTNIGKYNATSSTIQLAQGERWVGVSADGEKGFMRLFQLITTRFV